MLGARGRSGSGSRGRLGTLPVALFLSLLPATVSAQDSEVSAIFGAEPTIETLDNGLRVIVLPWDSPGIVSYFTLVRVGSRDEVESGHSGFAHLFEHMMFRGSENRSGDEYEALLQSFGADNNAFTTQDYTLYTLTAPSTVLDQVVELEADRFQNLSYDEATFRTETGAVRGEYDTSALNPIRRLWEALSEIAFTRHTYRHTTLGYLADIDRMPEEVAYSRSFFRRFYTPDNCTLIVVGDVTAERVMPLVRAQYDGWSGRRDRTNAPTEPTPRRGERRDIEWPAQAAPRMMLGYRVPAFEVSGARRRRSLRTTAALQAIHGLVFSESAPLYQRLVVSERRLVSLGSWSGSFTRDPGLFVATATLAEGAAFEDILDAVQGTMDDLGRGGVSSDRLEAVKSHLRYSLLTGLETPSDAAQLIAAVLAVSRDLDALGEYLDALAALTPERVAAVAREHLNARRRFVVTLSHAEEESEEQERDGERSDEGDEEEDS